MNRDFKVKIETEEEFFTDLIAQAEKIDQGANPRFGDNYKIDVFPEPECLYPLFDPPPTGFSVSDMKYRPSTARQPDTLRYLASW